MDFVSISGILSQNTYFSIPDYQRDYDWTIAENSTLLDDIIQISKEREGTTHFFGAIVIIPYNETDGLTSAIKQSECGIGVSQIKHVVDGQQRLASFSVLIAALRKLIIDDTTISQSVKDDTANFTLASVLKGTSSNGKRVPKLVLNGNTGKCYLNVVMGENVTYSKVYRGAKRLVAAYDYYCEELKKQAALFIEENICSNTEEFYLKMFDAIWNRATFVPIECAASADAFQVFDSLNGKGLDLTAADRIKNIFMSWSPTGEGVQKWNAFVSGVGEDYLTSYFISLFYYYEGKRVSKNKLPDQFKVLFKDAAKAEYDSFYEKMKDSGDLFGIIRTGKTENEKLDKLLKDFEALRFDQIYVLLFAVAFHYGKESVGTDEYYKLAKMLFSLVVRMQVCNMSMNKLDGVFANCILKMKTSSISVITSSLAEKVNEISDERFKNDFVEFSPSDNKISRVYVRYLEDYARKENGGDRNPVEVKVTVEHIIPENLTSLSDWYGEENIPDEIRENFKDEVVQNIGNKAVLYADDNTSAGKKKYTEKIQVYKHGKAGQTEGVPENTFQLIKELLEDYPEKFTHEEVRLRAKRLAGYAVKIWGTD